MSTTTWYTIRDQIAVVLTAMSRDINNRYRNTHFARTMEYAADALEIRVEHRSAQETTAVEDHFLRSGKRDSLECKSKTKLTT